MKKSSEKNKMFDVINILIVSLLVILVITVYKFINHSIENSKMLKSAVDEISQPSDVSEAINQCSITLYNADNNFRMYLATKSDHYLSTYISKLNEVKNKIDTLSTTILSYTSSKEFDATIENKLDLSNRIIEIKHEIDSITSKPQRLKPTPKALIAPAYDIKKIEYFSQSIKTDSIVPVFDSTGKDTRFITRLRNLFVNKQDDTPKFEYKTISSSETQDSIAFSDSDSTKMADFQKAIQVYYQDVFNAHNYRLKVLDDEEKKLASINSDIINNINQLLIEIRNYERNRVNHLRYDAKITSDKAQKAINNNSTFSVALFAFMTIGVMILLNEVKKRDRALKVEYKKLDKISNSKSRLINVVTHEIKAPISNIPLLIKQCKNDSQNTEKYLDIIEDSALHIQTTTNHILNYNLLEDQYVSISASEFDLHGTLSETINLTKPKAVEKGLNFETKFTDNTKCIISSDRNKIQEILINLVDNAIKYTNKGTVSNLIEIIHKENNQDYLRFVIKDTGTGIPKERQSKLFDEKTNIAKGANIEGSTGLGLAITKKLVELLKGNMELVESNNKGTTFEVLIPVTIVNETSLKASTESNTEKEVANVLIVDDDAISLTVITNILKDNNFKVLCAESYKSAVAAIEENDLDLIITDINLPDGNGKEIIVKTKQVKPDVPVMVSTAHTNPDLIEDIINTGACAVIGKPVSTNNILSEINKHLKKTEIV